MVVGRESFGNCLWLPRLGSTISSHTTQRAGRYRRAIVPWLDQSSNLNSKPGFAQANITTGDHGTKLEGE